MVTSTNRQLPGTLHFLPSSAYTGGVDFDARFRKFYSLTGFFAASRVNGDPTAIEALQEDSRHYLSAAGRRRRSRSIRRAPR